MVGFFPDFCVFQDLSTGQVNGIGKEEHGLHILNEGPPSTPKKLVNDSRAHANSIKTESSNIQQKRLGHAPIDVINKHDSLRFLSDKDQSHCTVCPIAKQTKLPFALSTHKSEAVFELLHCDIWGPYKVPTHNVKRFLVTSKADTIVV